MSVTRRMIAFLGISLLTCTTGCSTDSPGLQNSAGQTRQVTDIEDTVVDVPVNPQRIVALSEPTLDGLLALGITPVGAVAGRGQRTLGPPGPGGPGSLSPVPAAPPVLGARSWGSPSSGSSLPPVPGPR